MKTNLAATGVFVISAVLLFGAGLFLIGNGQDAFSHHHNFYTEMSNVNGLAPGSKVQVSGFDAGDVDVYRFCWIASAEDATVEEFFAVADDAEYNGAFPLGFVVYPDNCVKPCCATGEIDNQNSDGVCAEAGCECLAGDGKRMRSNRLVG